MEQTLEQTWNRLLLCSVGDGITTTAVGAAAGSREEGLFSSGGGFWG